ncbi:hypothetical protein V2J09_008838 [Rumex salicifolius]
MLPPSPTTLARSSLEEMLENIKRRDEKPKDLPPALPSRPKSRGRLPHARLLLPAKFTIYEEEMDGDSNEGKRKSDDVAVIWKNNKLKRLCEDSPYNFPDPHQTAAGQRSGGVAAATSTSRPAVDWEDNIGYFVNKKLSIWCRLSSGQWELGTIQSISGEEASVCLVSGDVVKVLTRDLLPANPDVLEGVDNLIQLSYLNEPSVLHNLQCRFHKDMIYSKAGPILIAVNPFKGVHIYGSNFISGFREKLVDSPHVYAVSDAAYDEMTKDGVNQSVIVSGESGAGKTETAKIAMQYLAALGGGGSGIEHEILQTSYILESFGNAKTSRNDNSSRFGKLIEIHFSAIGKMCGAAIQTFESSSIDQGGKIIPQRLNIREADCYFYLNQSDCLTIVGVDDACNYNKLMGALDIVQINKDDKENMLSILSSVLWLGNIKFEVVDSENHVEVVEDEAVTYAAKLMGCCVQDLMRVLSTCSINAGKDSIVKKLTLQQATDSRDALAKFIYASLFDWLVDQINKSLAVGKPHTGRAISILDIYGFESFQRNSFEQLCINYANERLQQHFNRHLFKLEQEDYEADGIDWTKVDFEDNQECLNLFEKKPLGLLSLLDEESNFPKATDVTFADKLKQHLSSNPCFKVGRDKRFSIRHYAGEVSYDTGGFLEKNRDPLPSESIHILVSSSCSLLQSFASNILKAQSRMSGFQKQSVGTKFKGQLYKLMQRLESTTPHFIRCIKPNRNQLPGLYEKDLVAQQLKCCGVLEVVRIARSGYPSRITHQEFAIRYGFLLLDKNVTQDPLSISVAVLQQFNILPDMYQVGYTKLYFRTGQIAGLEIMRKQVLQSVLCVQKFFRGYKARNQYLDVKKRVALLQSFIRGENARRFFSLLSKKRKERSRTQKHRHKQSASRDEQHKAIVHLQCVIRGWLTRNQVDPMQRSESLKPKNADANERPASKIPQVERQLVNGEAPSVQQEYVSDSTQTYEHVEEVSLEQKEEENAALKLQLKQYEKRLSDYELRMKSMEEMWQKQIKSLQVSLASAKRSLASDNAELSPLPTPHYYDSEDNLSPVAITPSSSTPNELPSNVIVGGVRGREPNGTSVPVSQLAKEFEQRRKRFDDDAKALAEVSNKSGSSIEDDLRRLKFRFDAWKKDYKMRLRETKGTLQRHGNSEADRRGRKWWGKLSQRIT